MIDIESLAAAIAQLEEALDLMASDQAGSDPRLARHLRAACLQAFEFTYELAYKTLKRFLEDTAADPARVASRDFSGIIRMGYAAGVLNEEIAAWRQFRDDRAITSHTYNEMKARRVYDAIPRFLAEARYLLDSMATRQAPA